MNLTEQNPVWRKSIDYMKKKLFIVMMILLVIVLLFPIPLRMKDGGTVRYQAIIYSISDVHQLTEPNGYKDGLIIEILGIEIYNNVDIKPDMVEYRGRMFNKADLSTETIEWLEWYNELSETEQLAISYIPHEIQKILD